MTLELWQIIWVSIKVAFFATVSVMIFSVFLANFLVRTRSIFAKILEILVYLPMAMPPVALGYGLLLIFGRKSVLGQALHDYFSIDLAFSFLGAVIAAFFVSLGIGVRTLRIALERIDESQIQVAELLGGSFSQIFFHIVVPQCRFAILGGGILVFIRALGEFGATMVLAGNTLGQTRTLAQAIWLGMETPDKQEECLILILVSIIISIFCLLAAELLVRQKS